MIYEISWNTHDLISLIIVLCFLPLLLCFWLVQLKYKTNNDDKEKAPLKLICGSKSQTKFVMSIFLIILMLFAVSPSIPLIQKYKIMGDYKNGQFQVIDNAEISISYPYFIYIENDSKHISIDLTANDQYTAEILDHLLKDSEKYRVYYSASSKDVWYMSEPVILRIEGQL